MTDTGLTTPEIESIRTVLRRYPDVAEAWLYGSRAKGTYKPYSDIDIVLVGIENGLRAEAIAEDLEDLPLPYRFDVQPYDMLKYGPLRDHIARVGVRLYLSSQP